MSATTAQGIGVSVGNVVLVLGVLLLARRVYASCISAHIRHVKTGRPIPALNYFERLANFFGLAKSPKRDYNPLHLSPEETEVYPVLICAEDALNNVQEYGPTYVHWRGGKPIVVVSAPEDARRLLNDKGELFHKSPLIMNPTLSRLLGSSLATATGNKWKVQRRAMDPAFKHKNIRTLVPMFAHCTHKLINKWEQKLNQPIRVEDGLTEVTLDAIGMGAFGYDFGAVDGVTEMGKNLEHYHRIMTAVFRPSAENDNNKKLEQSIREFRTFLQHVINTRREDHTDNRDLDLLDHIITMNEDGLLSDDEISHNLFLLFLAGHDTSSSALTAALYFLAQHPHEQEKAFKEVHSVLGGRDDFDFAHLSKLEYLLTFLKETLRMRPPVCNVGAAGRTVVADRVVLGGYVIPKGVTVSASIAALHYDETQWPDPYTFKPERFTSKDAGKDIWAFSTGPRVCMGKKFAMTEMLTVLAMLLQQFEFKLVSPDYQWQFRPFSLTLRPLDGMPLRLVQRQPSHT